MASHIRVFIQSSLVSDPTEVFPTIKGEFEYKKESGKVYFKHESKDRFTFSTKEDYALIKPHFVSECEEIDIWVQRKRQGVWSTYWRGFFKMFDARDDRDKCSIHVKVKPLDAYKCFEEQMEVQQNIFSSGTVISVSSIGGTLETETCTDTIGSADLSDYYAAYYTPLADCITPGEWCLKDNLLYVNGQLNYSGQSVPFNLEQETIWQREVFTTNCEGGLPVEPPFGSDWNLLEDNCSGDNTATWWRCPSSSGFVAGPYTRGRTFENIMSKILMNMGCDLSLKSDFFNINPKGDAPDNIAYQFAEQYCHNITVHQKSDIKLPFSVLGSTSESWNILPKDWFEDLRRMFNVQWIIQNGTLIIEHASFFSSSMGMNLSGEPMPKILEYGSAENVKFENYYWPEDPSFSFRSNSIIYDCGEKTKEERCTLISTDITYIQEPNNSERVSDSGFVLISNGLNGSDYIINDNNEPFTWVNLQENLFKHNRLYKSGKINNVSQEFLTWQRYIKQDKFKTPLCSIEFDPLDLITTDLGIASVGNAVENIFTNQIELELLY